MPFFFGGGASVDLASPSAIGNTTPNTGAFTTLSFAPANNTTGFSNTSNSLTGSNAQSLISLAQTWNTTGTPTAIKLNITDTASGSASYLMDLQVGGATKFRVGKGSVHYIGGNFVLGGTALECYNSEATALSRTVSSRVVFFGQESGIGMAMSSSYGISWSSNAAGSGDCFTNRDLFLLRDGAGILGQRNATNAQAFRLYNTFTSSTNFERLNFRWASNEFILDAEAGSAGGTLRGIKIGSATSSLLGFYGVTPVDQPATVTDPTGGGTQDAEARTAINAIIDRLQELGLIA